jgi:hypothetical protein
MKSFDGRCLELAEYFMPEDKWTAEDKNELAALIQSTIEDFLNFWKDLRVT